MTLVNSLLADYNFALTLKGSPLARHLQRLFVLTFICCLPFFLMPISVRAAVGDLDPAYGSGGKVTTDFFGNFDIIRDAAVQPDGKLVVVGEGQGADSVQRSGLARYRLNGGLDTAFGSNGKVVNLLGVRASSVVIQPDGKIIVAGGRSGDFALVRFKKDGSFDTAFGNGGLTTIDFFGTTDFAWNLDLQANGKIVVVGDADNAGWLALARVNSDGRLDTAFGNGGKVTPGIGPSLEQGLAVKLQPDQKIVAVGHVNNGALTKNDFAIVRFNANGQLDETFGSGGKVITDFDNGFDTASDVIIQPDGKIVAGGEASFKFGLARYNADGSLDNDFGVGGKVTTGFFGRGDRAFGLARQFDGKIVAAGSAVITGGDGTAVVRNFALARYAPDGSIDTTFGELGKITTSLDGDSFATCLVLQPDGKLVAAGTAKDFGDFGLARYLTTPANAPVLQTEGNSNRALALDSVTLLRDSFSVITEHNFRADQRTRIMLFATNLTLSSGEGFSSVSVQAQDSAGATHTLPVEYIVEVPGFEWLTEIVVKLPDDLANAGDVQVSISLRGEISNSGIISIR